LIGLVCLVWGADGEKSATGGNRATLGWFIWLVWFVWSIWFVSIFCSSHQMNQINKNNQRNQNNQLNQLIAASGISHHPAGEKIDRQMEMIHPLSVDSQFSSTGSEVGLFAGCGLGFTAVGSADAAGVVTVGLGAGSV
jgi:hypothetical protein